MCRNYLRFFQNCIQFGGLEASCKAFPDSGSHEKRSYCVRHQGDEFALSCLSLPQLPARLVDGCGSYPQVSCRHLKAILGNSKRNNLTTGFGKGLIHKYRTCSTCIMSVLLLNLMSLTLDDFKSSQEMHASSDRLVM